MPGEAPLKGLNDNRGATEIVDRRLENCGYFIPDLIYSAEILKGIAELAQQRRSRAREGDDHVGAML
jgi:hypothetical protein